MALIVDRLQRIRRSNRRRLYNEPELARLVEFGRVSASLIHEMSTPLSAAALVIDQMGNSKQRDRNISQVRNNLRVLERYVVAARQQLKGESRSIGFSLTIAIHQVAMILSGRAKAANVKLLINTIGSIRIYGDPVKFHQILTNLLNNAIEAHEHSDASSRFVSVKVELQTPAKVMITITDNGVGINPKQLKRIFDPFYSTKAHAGRGLGIGLDITKTYVEQDFGGSIKAYSSELAGTTFKLSIPIKQNLS